MNFENYNKIYQEILDDENDQLSSNYLLNKYEIKHDEELINILNQIKKNEYISSDNKVINRLLSELDEDEDLLNINEIIEIKEKVISNGFDNEDLLEHEEANKPQIEKNNVFEEKSDFTKNKKNSNLLDNININFNIKYSIIIIFIFFILSSFYFVDFSENNTKKINKKQITSSLEVEKNIEKQIKEKNLEQVSNELVSPTDQITQKENNISKKIEEKIDDTVDNKLDKIKVVENEQDNFLENTNEVEKNLNVLNTQNTIILDSLEDIEKYKDQLMYDDGKLIFNDIAYGENDTLFGFRIYKLTSIYVKFQDEKNQLRKRILLNN